MNKISIYNTKQKDKILGIIKKENKNFTAKDIYLKLNKEVGLTTIYRFIDDLYSKGYLNKYINDKNVLVYDYLEKCKNENHFYLKCMDCGRLFHIDCDCIDDLYYHIRNNHKFKLNKENIIIKGICNNCIKKER